MCVRPTKINERGEEKIRKREAQPGKRQCMSRATTGCSSQSQIYAVDSSIHALPVPRLCLSFAAPSLSYSNPHFTLPHTCHHLSFSKIRLPHTLIDYFVGFLFDLCCNFVQIYNETKANHCRTC